MPPGVFANAARQVENAVFIGDSFAFSNYAHWTLDWLPRLRWIREHCDLAEAAIVFNKKPTRFNIAMLEKLGFKRENVIAPDAHEPTFLIQVRNVYTTNQAREFRHGAYAGAAWAIEFLRDSFQQKERSAFDYGLKLVIMRGQRGLTFSDVVRRELERRGFIFVRPELLDHNSQVELFANASAVIATHGAGLSNLAFCQPGTKVLELFNKTLSTHAFYTIAEFGGLDYSCAVTDPLEPAKSGKPIDDDCHLDASTFFQWVDAVGL
jgi:capsular polysaccharide biosynthesis protein